MEVLFHGHLCFPKETLEFLNSYVRVNYNSPRPVGARDELSIGTFELWGTIISIAMSTLVPIPRMLLSAFLLTIYLGMSLLGHGIGSN